MEIRWAVPGTGNWKGTVFANGHIYFYKQHNWLIMSKKRFLQHPNRPFLLSGCGTRQWCLQNQCGNLWSSPAHSWDSTWEQERGDKNKEAHWIKIITGMRNMLSIWSQMYQCKSYTFLRPLVYSLLYFGIMHVNDGVSGVSLSLLEMTGPHVVHPVNEVHLYS